jgi:DNA-binding MarR family transcriptional regulator
MTGKYYTAENYSSQSSIGYLLRHASKLLTNQVTELFSECEISFIQFIVMMILHEGSSTTAAEIAHHLCHDSGALTRVIDQLEQAELIKREKHAHDKRVMELTLTEKGNSLLQQSCPAIIAYYNAVLAEFTHEEADHLLALLKRLIMSITHHADMTSLVANEETL